MSVFIVHNFLIGIDFDVCIMPITCAYYMSIIM